MPRYINVTDRDISNAVQSAASGSRSAALLRAALEIVVRLKGGNLTLEYLDKAIDSLADYFISDGEASRCRGYFENLYDEQQNATA